MWDAKSICVVWWPQYWDTCCEVVGNTQHCWHCSMLAVHIQPLVHFCNLPPVQYYHRSFFNYFLRLESMIIHFYPLLYITHICLHEELMRLKPLGLNERCFESSPVKGGRQGCLTAAIPLFLQTLWPLRWRATAAVEEQMLKGQYKVQRLRWDNKSLFLWLLLLLSFSLPLTPASCLLPLSLSLTHTSVYEH